jgi:hypothetical protein
MNEINEQLKGISELIIRIDAKVLEINNKLDELIAALHEYDDENIYKGYDEPNNALKEAAAQYNEELNKEYGESSFEAFQFTNEYLLSLGVEEAERRMDIIGQNGNTGEHYENEIINKPATTNVEKKKRDKRNKWVSPYPPNPKRNVNKNNAG